MPSTASISAVPVPSFSAAASRSPREIAGFVDQIDEILSDHAPRRIGNRERKLLAQPRPPEWSRRRQTIPNCNRRPRGHPTRRWPSPNSHRAGRRCCAGGSVRSPPLRRRRARSVAGSSLGSSAGWLGHVAPSAQASPSMARVWSGSGAAAAASERGPPPRCRDPAGDCVSSSAST